LNLRAAVNYNHARFGSFPNAPCSNGQLISEGCNQLLGGDGAFHAQDLSGRPLVRAPKWTISSGVDYEMPVGQSMKLSFGVAANYSSKYYTSLLLLPGYVQDDFTKVNANVALRSDDDSWEVALIGNNINNEITTSNCLNAPLQGAVVFGGTIQGTDTRGPGGDDYPFCLPERGREVWLRVTARPGFLNR
jgi:iron complex outermembrane receptor protein